MCVYILYILSLAIMYLAILHELITVHHFSGDTHERTCKIPQGSQCLRVYAFLLMILNACDTREHAHPVLAGLYRTCMYVFTSFVFSK